MRNNKLLITLVLTGVCLLNVQQALPAPSVTDEGSRQFHVEPRLPEISGETYDVVDFGALGTGTVPDTEAIQDAIDACAGNGGGTVLFRPGVYLSGTLYVGSYVNFHLEKGAVLKGSTHLEDYPVTIPEIRSYTDNYSVRSLIYAENESHIALTGEGIIDGQGSAFPVTREVDVYKLRPYLIRLIGCDRILVDGITLLNSPMWFQHYLACDNLTIRKITVAGRRSNYNNDGIDIDACHHVRITGCDISAEDDAIVLKSTMNRSCENIMVDNCSISSLANAFKCGTESNGGFKNISFVNSHIYDTDNSGIALEIVDGGTMEDVFVSNITMDNVNNPIFIRLGNRARPYSEESPDPGIGSISNVLLRNISATNIGAFDEPHPFRTFVKNESHIPSSISGLPGYPVKDITLSDIFIQYTGGYEKPSDSFPPVPEAEKRYPEFDMFGQLPAYGFYLRHAEDIRFDHVKIELVNTDLRREIYLDKNTGDIYRDGRLIQ